MSSRPATGALHGSRPSESQTNPLEPGRCGTLGEEGDGDASGPRPFDQRNAPNRAELEELELPLDELELEDDDLDDELDDELDDDLDDELDEPALDDDELDVELEEGLGLEDELADPSGPMTVPSVHACSSMPRPARATLPESIRRNCRRSSRRASGSASEGCLCIKL